MSPVQINLIALNATIEAARAGEAGAWVRGGRQRDQDPGDTDSRRHGGRSRQHVDAVHEASSAADGDLNGMKQAFAELYAISSEIAGSLDIQLGATDAIGHLVKEAVHGAGRRVPSSFGTGPIVRDTCKAPPTS